MSAQSRETIVVQRIASGLMYVGAVVAVLGVTAWVLDIIPAMPAWMVRIAIYKLTLAGAVGLIVVGAALRRAAVRRASSHAELATHARLPGEGVGTRVGLDREGEPVEVHRNE